MLFYIRFSSVLINRLRIDSLFPALEKTQAELFDLKTKYDEESTAKYVSVSGCRFPPGCSVFCCPTRPFCRLLRPFLPQNPPFCRPIAAGNAAQSPNLSITSLLSTGSVALMPAHQGLRSALCAGVMKARPSCQRSLWGFEVLGFLSVPVLRPCKRRAYVSFWRALSPDCLVMVGFCFLFFSKTVCKF